MQKLILNGDGVSAFISKDFFFNCFNNIYKLLSFVIVVHVSSF